MFSLCLRLCLCHFCCLRCRDFQSGYLGLVCQITFVQWLRILIRFLDLNILGPSYWHLLNKTFRSNFRYVIRNSINFKMSRFLYPKPWKLVLNIAIKLIIGNREDTTQLYKWPLDPFHPPNWVIKSLSILSFINNYIVLLSTCSVYWSTVTLFLLLQWDILLFRSYLTADLSRIISVVNVFIVKLNKKYLVKLSTFQ